MPLDPRRTDLATPPRDAGAGIDAGRMLQLQDRLLSEEGFPGPATAFCGDLALLARADRVAIGFVEHGQARLAALSHEENFRPDAEPAAAIAAAMDEAIEQQATLRHPEPAGARPRVIAAHAALSRREGGCAATIPLARRGEVFGAITLARRRAEPFSDAEIAQVENVARLLGPVVRLKHREAASWSARTRAWLGGAVRSLVQPGHAAFKTGAATALIVAGAAAFIPVDYRIGAPARVEGAIQRTLVAPADGFLRELHARPGDRVPAGQALAELAQDDLRLEQRKWESELIQHENAAAAALARSDRAQFAVSQARAEEARAQLDLAAGQLARTRILAPFDGIIIAGDLTQSLGAPVRRGETLLTIAPEHRFRLVVEVDERDIADVRVGQPGRLALGAFAGRSLPFRIARITPMATARDGRNFFEVEGELEDLDTDLRPGLQGVAKIEAGEHPAAWIWSRRVVNWLRLAAWSWGA
jgi:RND family efflux transporter MFP subunit